MECILGCGNPDRGDDAAGLLVARRLREFGIPACEFMGDGLALIEAWRDCRTCILVDAVVTGCAPGDITIWDGRDAPVMLEQARSSTHAFGVAEAVELARVLQRMPERLVLYGIEGRQFKLGSPPGAAILAAAEKLARQLARRR